MSVTYADGTPVEPCPGCPEFRLDCACVTDITQMPLADVKAVFAAGCLDPDCTDCGASDHVCTESLSIDPVITGGAS